MIDSKGNWLNVNEPAQPFCFAEKQTALDFAELYVRLNPDRECYVVDGQGASVALFRIGLNKEFEK